MTTHYVVHDQGVPLAFASDLESAQRIATMLQANVEILAGEMPVDAETASAEWMRDRCAAEDFEGYGEEITKVERPSGFQKKVTP